jgi:protein-tyrosine phosphatase
MTEFVLREMAPADWQIASRATGSWEHGNPVHSGTRRALVAHGVAYDTHKTSQKITSADFASADVIYGMDAQNVSDLQALAPDRASREKIQLFPAGPVPDPWYTGDFEETYRLIDAGCQKIVKKFNKIGRV